LGQTSESTSQASKVYAALPEETGAVAFSIKAENSVQIIIENYLRHYKSPLLPFASQIVECSDRNGIDPRLIVAIAQQESNLGKITPPDCFNAWGWGIHARGTKCFLNWPEAIEIVVKGIAEKYCAKGFCENPCIMMTKYTPQSNGSWCFGVNQFLREMELGEF